MDYPKYQPHPDRDTRINSAITAIRAILPLDLYLAHKKELLSVCIWKITEADGKKKVRYWTEAAIKSDRKSLQHEHVFERRELITRLLSGEKIESVVNEAIACSVTKSEHKDLGTSDRSGWLRYQDCNIRVYDSLEDKWF